MNVELIKRHGLRIYLLVYIWKLFDGYLGERWREETVSWPSIPEYVQIRFHTSFDALSLLRVSRVIHLVVSGAALAFKSPCVIGWEEDLLVVASNWVFPCEKSHCCWWRMPQLAAVKEARQGAVLQGIVVPESACRSAI